MTSRNLLRGAPMGLLAASCALLAASLAAAGTLWWMKSSAEVELAAARDELQAHRTLEPVVTAVRERKNELRALLEAAPAYARPGDVRELLATLRRTADDAGLADGQFVPVAASVIGRNDIELVGRARGTSESFRRFVLGLSTQPWVTEIGSVSAASGDSGVHTLDIRIRAVSGLNENAQGEVK